MFCTKCGKQLADGTSFCPACGTPVSVPTSPAPTPAAPAYNAPSPAPTPAAPAYNAPATPAPDPAYTPAPMPAAPTYSVPTAGPAPAAPAYSVPTAEPAPDPADGSAPTTVLSAYNNPANNPAYGAPNSAAYGTPYGVPNGEQPAYAPNFYAPDPSFASPAPAPAPAPKKKKGKKGLIISIVAAVLAVVIALTVALNFQTIYGSVVLAFGSDAEYFVYVEAKDLKKTAETISAYYDSALLESLKMDRSANTTVSFTVGSELQNFLRQYSDETGDLSWINNAQLKIGSDLYRDKACYDAGLYLSGKQILSVEEYLDLAGGDSYLLIPALSDKALRLPASAGIIPNIAIGNESVTTGEMIDALRTVLPSEDVLNTLAERYIDTVLDEIKQVSVEKDSLTVGSVTQKCRRVTVVITEKDLLNIAEAVLRQAKTDKEIRTILEKCQQVQDKYPAIGDIPDMYGEFQELIEDALENIEYERSNATDRTVLSITDYVNSRHEIIGRRLSVEGETVLNYAEATSGKNYAMKAQLGEDLRLQGEGTLQGDKRSGSYTLSVDDYDDGLVEMLELEVSDFDTARLAKGYLSGKFTLRPAKRLLDRFLDDEEGRAVTAMLSVFDPAVELTVESDNDELDLSVNLLNGSAVWFGADVECDFGDGEEIKTLSAQVVDLNDSEQVREFLGTLNFDGVLRSLREAGLPRELLEALEERVGTLQAALQFYANGGFIYDDSYDDDPWNDDWTWDDDEPWDGDWTWDDGDDWNWD